MEKLENKVIQNEELIVKESRRCKVSVLTNHHRGCPRGITVKALDCGNVLSEFELQSRSYVHFQTITLGKNINSLILSTIG